LPTFSVEDRFRNEYRQLKRWEQDRFTSAWHEFPDALLQWEIDGAPGLPRFPAALRVKDVNGFPGIWELTWATDGRCTWEYGNKVLPDKVHVVWRRIGGHDIFNDP
jgi:hypothetical protein